MGHTALAAAPFRESGRRDSLAKSRISMPQKSVVFHVFMAKVSCKLRGERERDDAIAKSRCMMKRCPERAFHGMDAGWPDCLLAWEGDWLLKCQVP